ncbi:hypothetical protein GOARA_036_00040 [Gordonia araii NBRC 100433]|uniref:Uncharacterized protein n=1 Tax=Gordonia araii NBRC 100433 TaxID=1073574 RepID=G7H097_9ACTN|nr:hypothetical protein GOARA_036_00040 [Gordonia araii NBRC 100433]
MTALLAGALTSCSSTGTDRGAVNFASRIGVSVPANASHIKVNDPPFTVQGGCSSLEFLIPEADWAAYVTPYFGADELDDLSSAPGFCGHALIDCEGGALVKGFQASGQHDGIGRSIEVIPHCVNGQARIAWGTTE